MTRIPFWSNPELMWSVMRGLPPRIRQVLGEVPTVFESDPVAIGLHKWGITDDGRAFSGTSHVAWGCHQQHLPASLRETTMVLNGDVTKEVVIHELGHVLDCRLGFYRPTLIPLDAYAATNIWEAFATAFQAWLTSGTDDSPRFHTWNELMSRDPGAVAFFESI